MKFFGTTVAETLAAFEGAQLGPKAGAKQDEKTKAIVRMVISFLVLLAGVFFVSRPQGNSQSIGAGMIGAVTGYWLK